MTFPILGGNSAIGGYEIANSLRFNDDDSPRLSKTFASNGDRTTWSFSTWIKISTLGTSRCLISGRGASTFPFGFVQLNSNDELNLRLANGSSINWSADTNMLFRDTSAFYHILVVFDSGNATLNDRFICYVNGVLQDMTYNQNTLPQDSNHTINSTDENNVGCNGDGSGGHNNHFDGYMAETHFIDGQALTPTDFGEFDEDSGIWKPIRYSGSYGTNGFKLDFSDSGSLGADSSPNSNSFTPSNLGATDQMLDTPTNNFATMNELDKSGMTLEEGNLKIFNNVAAHKSARGNFGMSSGKWYFECSISSVGTNQQQSFGLAKQNVTCPPLFNANVFASVWGFTGANSYHYIYNNGSTTGATLVSVAVGDILKCAYDADSGKLWLGKNTDWFNINGGINASANPATGTNPTMTLSETEPLVPYGHLYVNYGTWNVFNFGQEGSFAGNKTAQGNSDQNGYGDFYYAPPTGFLALCTQNLATELSPTIDDGSEYFNTVLYSGNGASNSVTGVGFQPDWTWIKRRDSGAGHNLLDSSRGSTKRLRSNTTDAEVTNINRLASFDSDGFTIGNEASDYNAVGGNYVAWNWKVNAGSTSSNTDGSITSTVQANTTAGFSIILYTGNSTNSTIGHGLGITPSFFMTKSRTQGIYGWVTYHQSLGATKGVFLNTNGGEVTDSTLWNNTEPTSSVISLGYNAGTNNNAQNYAMYAFAEIEGYSKFGSYTGNGSTDGTFIYTGFRPAFVIFKRTDIGTNWVMIDTARDTFNDCDASLYADLSNAEENPAGDVNGVDYLSNGFKFRDGKSFWNASGGTYIYMAFAENPFVTSGAVPVTAR